MNKIYLILLLSFLNANIISDLNKKINISRENAITNSISLTSSAVVGINVTQIKTQAFDPFFDPFFSNFFNYNSNRKYKIKNLGSGVIISKDGYIVTNSHVVENANEIIVSTANGGNYDAIVIGLDELTDIALIKIDSAEDFHYAIFGNSDDLIVGEWVIALGNPLGLFDMSNKPTATVGIVSGVDLDFGQKASGKVYQNMLQTDASINPGNSGGPLMNVLGEIIGINTFIMTNSGYNQGSIGIGFAIPSNTVISIIEELKQYGKIERNFITGLHVQSIDKTMQKLLKIGNKTGVIITNIDSDSSGENAGLLIGDVILKVNNNVIQDISDILKIINEGLHKVGDFITLDIFRNGEDKSIQLELKGINGNEVSY